MNWEAIGAIGEIVGAVAVLVTLIYLATQVRQAQRVARAQNVREVQAGFVRLFSALVQDADLMRTYRTGSVDPGRLDPVERHRFEDWHLIYFLHFVELHTAHQDGLMSSDLYQRWRFAVASHLQTPGATEWWTLVRDYFPTDVVDALEELRDQVPQPVQLRTIPDTGSPDSQVPKTD